MQIKEYSNRHQYQSPYAMLLKELNNRWHYKVKRIHLTLTNQYLPCNLRGPQEEHPPSNVINNHRIKNCKFTKVCSKITRSCITWITIIPESHLLQKQNQYSPMLASLELSRAEIYAITYHSKHENHEQPQHISPLYYCLSPLPTQI